MRCCFVAEIILVPREQTRRGGRQSKPGMGCCLSFALELLFMELLFALELLFIIRPHGAVEFLSCFVAEMLLFMELLCCKWGALLVGVRCWLSAGYQRVLAILY